MRATTALLLILLLLLLVPGLASANSYERKSYTTVHTGDCPPVIDGRLDDTCWGRVQWAGDFVQWQPAEGEAPAQPTAFKILFDDKALYVGFRAYDSEPARIVDHLARRDWFPGDWVEINIDSLDDDRTAFSFTASASGVRGDEFISNDGDNWDGNWDPVWELKTNIDQEGWTAEVKIPLSQLRYPDKSEQTWGIQVQRRVFREDERSLWQPKSNEEAGWVSRFGELHGIAGLSSARQIELMPYLVTREQRYEKVEGDPFRTGSDLDLSGGLDGKVGITGDLMMDFTINPDFGQVEADPSEVNLTEFESYFSERRPFFIEGRNILDFRLAPAITGGSFTSDNLFYSRRIGTRPHGYPDLADGEYADMPDNTSILGAAKLSGKTADGLSVGILESVTQRERAQIDGIAGERRETVEPLANYFVGRAQQDLREGNTQVGAIFTAVNRDIQEESLDWLHRSAYAGGMDFRHAWKDKEWYVEGNALMSNVRGSADAIEATQRASQRYYQRPDNDHVTLDPERTSLTGYSGALRLGRSRGHGMRFQTSLVARSPGFEINDLGYMRRADEVNQSTWAGYAYRKPFSVFREAYLNTNQWTNWDFGGTNLIRQYNMNFNFTLENNWRGGGGVTRVDEQISNTALRGGPSSRWPGELHENFWVNSDQRRAVTFNFGGSFGAADVDGDGYVNWWVSTTYRPSNALRLSLSPDYTFNYPNMQYVTRGEFGGEDRYVFGSMDQRTLALTFRMDYTVTPNLTIQYYGAPFLSSGSFRDFRYITDPKADRYEDRYHRYTDEEIAYDESSETYSVDEDRDGATDYEFGRPDFDFREFNSNLVVRWEFDPGSTLYLVWSQNRVGFTSDGNFRLDRDMDSLFGVHPHNVFLVKINKWFSL